jgi:eukaryotic-like serine/threonine-protein kinase
MRWREHAFDCSGLSWAKVAARLAELLELRAKSDDRFVSLSCGDMHRFVQFASGDPEGSVRCEAVSNQFLTGSKGLGKSTLSSLSALGWNEPTNEIPNFWRLYNADAKPPVLARLATRTMRGVFKISGTTSLFIDCAVFATATDTSISLFSRRPVPELKQGDEIVNRTTGQGYQIVGPLGRGGFGAAFRALPVDGPATAGELCVKVATTPEAWHREAYFGELLHGVPRAISVHSSFATFWPENRRESLPLYCLVTELASHGDLSKYLEEREAPWPEARACAEVAALLRVLVRLHQAGAVHRDLTPGNVLVTEGEHLKLGDFGIARHRLGRQAIAADVFNDSFAPGPIADGIATTWRPADDVYQMGIILAMLLGMPLDGPRGSAAMKDLKCSPPVKVILQRAIGDRRKRYPDAGGMLAALEARNRATRPRVRLPASLLGKTVAFTGALSALSRREAAALVAAAGGRVQPKVTSVTDIVVEGSLSPVWIAEHKGQKLLDVDREAERGHRILVIDEDQFLSLVRNRPSSAQN